MRLQILHVPRFIGICIISLVGVGLIIGLPFISGGTIKKPGSFEISSGQSAQVVIKNLEESGFITRTLPWRYQVFRQKAGDKFKVGTYTVTTGEMPAEVIARFVSGATVPDELTITYPEGFTLEQMAARTAARGIGTPEEFTRAATPAGFQEKFPLVATLPTTRTLEGYLFPDTYKVFVDDTVSDVIARLLSNFQEKITPEILAEVRASGRSLDEIIIMASVIEREVQTDADLAKVADVLWKRVDDGVGLDADATVRYALNKWDDPLTIEDLRIDSPYNTRRYRGLPPGPVSNPGLRAILAALRPEKNDFYYYLSTPQGETIFSETLDEHNRNKAKYL